MTLESAVNVFVGSGPRFGVVEVCVQAYGRIHDYVRFIESTPWTK
jgi:hypothetical protein